MKHCNTIRSLIVLLLAGPILAAQEQPKKPQETPGQPAEAAAKIEPGQLKFTVTGVTKENVVVVKDSLTGLTGVAYVCDPCKVDMAVAGKCSKCGGELKMEKKPLFASATCAEDGSVTLALNPSRLTRLSEIENALKKNSITIDPAKFPIAGKSEIVLKGGKAEDATAVEKALKDAKLFDQVHAAWDPVTSEIHVTVHAGATPPTRAKVATAVEPLKLQIGDVIWGRMPQKV